MPVAPDTLPPYKLRQPKMSPDIAVIWGEILSPTEIILKHIWKEWFSKPLLGGKDSNHCEKGCQTLTEDLGSYSPCGLGQDCLTFHVKRIIPTPHMREMEG